MSQKAKIALFAIGGAAISVGFAKKLGVFDTLNKFFDASVPAAQKAPPTASTPAPKKSDTTATKQ